jgi:hypothetical protein
MLKKGSDVSGLDIYESICSQKNLNALVHLKIRAPDRGIVSPHTLAKQPEMPSVLILPLM